MSDSDDAPPAVVFTSAQLTILDRHISIFNAADREARRKLRKALRKELQLLSPKVNKQDLYRVSIMITLLASLYLINSWYRLYRLGSKIGVVKDSRQGKALRCEAGRPSRFTANCIGMKSMLLHVRRAR